MARRVLLHVCGPLVLGALTYVGGSAHLLPRPPAWALGHTADALWAYAVGAFVTLLWRDGPERPRRAWTLVAFATVVLAEVGQRFGWVPGTFDPIDLLVTSAAFGLALLVTSPSPFLARRRTA